MNYRVWVLIAAFWTVASFSLVVPQEVVAASHREQGIHHQEGVQCKDCHGVEKPKKEADSKGCLECHGPYSKVAQRTQKLPANPHDSHMGPLDCLKCHGVHEPMEPEQIPCMECHADFEFKTK